MKKLSSFKFKNDHDLAYCSKCNEFFIDDISIYGSIYCPNQCGYCVKRNIKNKKGGDMGETVITKSTTSYVLRNGNCSILATIDHALNAITLRPTTLKNNNEFIFLRSDPNLVYVIGTLIRDAADLIGKD